MICRAPHPRGQRGDGRFEGRLCGKRLQVVPFRVRPTYRVLEDWTDVHPGCIAVRCVARDCRALSEYELVDELESGSGAPRRQRGWSGGGERLVAGDSRA